MTATNHLLQAPALFELACSVTEAVMRCPVYRVRVLLPIDHSPRRNRVTYILPAPSGWDAITDALDTFPSATSVSAICIHPINETHHALPQIH